MMTGALTGDQLQALARLVALLRPGWDVPGIASTLHATRHRAPAHEVAIAAIRCAMGDARTPAVIAMDGPHWRGLPVAETRAPRPAQCPEHHEPLVVGADGGETCRGCRADRLEAERGLRDPWFSPADDEHQRVTLAGAAACRAAITRTERTPR